MWPTISKEAMAEECEKFINGIWSKTYPTQNGFYPCVLENGATCVPGIMITNEEQRKYFSNALFWSESVCGLPEPNGYNEKYFQSTDQELHPEEAASS